MIIYLCIKYESNTLIFSKDIERKLFFVCKDETYRWTGHTYGQSFLGSGKKKIFKHFFLPYMGMVGILFNGVELFQQTVTIPSTEGSM